MQSSSSNSKEGELQHMQMEERVNASDFQNKCWQKNFIDGTKWEPENFRRTLLQYLEELDKLIDERVLKYDALRMKEKEVQAIKEIKNDIGPSYDSDTVSEVPHDMFANMFENMMIHGIQSHEQPESIPDTYKRAFFAALINNLKCDVEKCNEVNREAQQENGLLTNEIERYKEKEKHFAKDMIIESEYCKKIKLFNDEISYFKSQAYEKDKTFAKKNEKYDEYVQPLLERKNEFEKENLEFLKLDNRLRKGGQTDHTLRMLHPKEDNVQIGKHGLGFENQNDNVNPSVLNKAKELAPCLYNIDKM
ncbi:hypothetical protein Tco_1571252 [Tanacetum coccineum]